MVSAQAAIGDVVPPRQRGRYQGLFGAVFGLATVIGPLLGGALTTNLSWRVDLLLPLTGAGQTILCLTGWTGGIHLGVHRAPELA